MLGIKRSKGHGEAQAKAPMPEVDATRPQAEMTGKLTKSQVNQLFNRLQSASIALGASIARENNTADLLPTAEASLSDITQEVASYATKHAGTELPTEQQLRFSQLMPNRP